MIRLIQSRSQLEELAPNRLCHSREIDSKTLVQACADNLVLVRNMEHLRYCLNSEESMKNVPSEEMPLSVKGSVSNEIS